MVFRNNWFSGPGIMRESPREVEKWLKRHSPARTHPTLDNIKIIITADQHGSAAFQWADKKSWSETLSALSRTRELVLHLESSRQDAPLQKRASALRDVAIDRVLGFELEPFIAVNSTKEIRDRAGNRYPVHYRSMERQAMLLAFNKAARMGYWVKEYKDLENANRWWVEDYFGTNQVVRAVANQAINWATHFGGPASGKQFNDLVIDYLKAVYAERVTQKTHRLMGGKINDAMGSRPNALHLVSVGNAHLGESTGIHNFIHLNNMKYGILDSLTY